jgi:hypothetical protein
MSQSLKNWMSVALLGLCGCSQLPFLRSHTPLSSADLQIQVLPSKTLGEYAIQGNTDLPNQSQIRVAAIRYLYPTNPASQALHSKPTYSVLAYQTAEVTQGKWQTTLNLWQVAPDGQFQEAWQGVRSDLKLALNPASEVVFLATLPPGAKTDQLQQVEQQLEKAGKVLNTRLVQSTTEGDRYLQAAQILTIALPTGKTTPPPSKPEEINGGWGNRFLIPPEPQNPYQLKLPENRRTNARPSPSEFLR